MGSWAGMSSRTLTRRFRAETGFSFNEWRQRIRLLRALELLAAGKPVTAIALDLGYDNVSAFIALFRRMFGTTRGGINFNYLFAEYDALSAALITFVMG